MNPLGNKNCGLNIMFVFNGPSWADVVQVRNNYISRRKQGSKQGQERT